MMGEGGGGAKEASRGHSQGPKGHCPCGIVAQSGFGERFCVQLNPFCTLLVVLAVQAKLCWCSTSSLKGREKAIVNQTNTGTVSKATLAKLLSNGWSACGHFRAHRYHLEPY